MLCNVGQGEYYLRTYVLEFLCLYMCLFLFPNFVYSFIFLSNLTDNQFMFVNLVIFKKIFL